MTSNSWCSVVLLVYCLLSCSNKTEVEDKVSRSSDVISKPSLEPSLIRFQDSSDLLGLGPMRVFGVALVDYNEDGWPDVTLATKKGILLYRNTGDLGGFINDNARAGFTEELLHVHQLVWVDYDDDGDLDLYVTRREMPGSTGVPQKHSNYLFQNDGQARFKDVTGAAGLAQLGYWEGAAFGDLDGDGDLDLAVLGGIDFVDTSSVEPGHEGAPNAYFRNVGAGKFEVMTEEMGCTGPDDGVGWGLLLVDFDHDGDLDMFISNDRRASTLCRNKGNGEFEDISDALSADVASYGAMGISAGDVNGDGCMELYATIFGPDVLVTVNKGGDFLDLYPYVLGEAADPSLAFSGYGASFLDADLDGDQDIIWVAAFDTQDYGEGIYIPGGMGLLENRGSDKPGTLIDAGSDAHPLFAGVHHAWGLARGDYDRDGDMDVLIGVDTEVPAGGIIPAGATVHSTSILLENVTPRKNRRFLELSLSQPSPNSRAVGATVIVSVGGRRALQVVTAGSSYLSAHQYPLHFGLGDADKPDWVFVRWPDGTEQTFTDITQGRIQISKGSETCRPAGSCKGIIVSECHDFKAEVAAYKESKGGLGLQSCQTLCAHMESCGWFPNLDFCDYEDCVLFCPTDDIPSEVGNCIMAALCQAPPRCLGGSDDHGDHHDSHHQPCPGSN